jgi:class 3 adenylate cyclase
MDLFNFFCKNKTFFLSLYFICQILSTDTCGAKNTGERASHHIADNRVSPVPFLEPATVINTIKDQNMFTFRQNFFFGKHTKSCFKRKKDPDATSYYFDCMPLTHIFTVPKFFVLTPAFLFSGWVNEALFGWMPLSAVILATLAGYLCGKRRGQRMAAVKEYPVNVPPPIVLSRTDRYEALAEEEKPFIQKYDTVTVLFADIEGFSEITDSLEPETLLDELNSFFFYFDTIIDRYHIEKIKTMGDAYMCAGGIPQKNHTNPVDVVLVALDVQNHLNRLSKQNPNVWSVRIGIHTGQVVAGMLGHKKLSFDIWGHTVNVAARLESSCKAGKISISGTTYEKIKRYFDCECQGILPHTNDVSYYVNGLKPEFVETGVDGQPAPNYAFFVQMQLLRLGDLEEYVESMMTDTSSNLFFHNLKHVLDVYEQVELLAHSENVRDEDTLLLKTAALMHDIGYAISYGDDIRTLSEDMARETLLLFHYKPQQIEKIYRLMKAAHCESIPNGILEEIMHDAHQMYFGRADYITRMMSLFREQKEHHISVNKAEWLRGQITCLTSHRFYTRAARELVKVSANQQIANTKELHAGE